MNAQPSGGPADATYCVPLVRWADLGAPVRYVDHGGPADGPVLVCVHGLGGSAVNWAALAPLLTTACRVIALDLAGFGLSQPDPAVAGGTSVTANQELLQRFLAEVVQEPAVLVGNSMGGLITILETARHPDSVSGLVLLDPALPTDVRTAPHPMVTVGFALYAVPRVGAAFMGARRRGRTAEQYAREVMRLCCSDPSRVSEGIFRQHVELARQREQLPGTPDFDAQFLLAARSLLRTVTPGRAYQRMMHRIDDAGVSVLLIHGDEDRLVSVAAARTVARAHPTWRFEVAEGVGHVPQLEVPDWTAATVLSWLTEVGLLPCSS